MIKFAQSMSEKILLFGHRGARGEAPENTMPAFQKALDAGMDGIELDARICRTGEVVVVHDATLARITARRLPVMAYSLSELKKLDVGSHFSEKYQGERIPLLEDVLELFGDKLILDIELKGKNIYAFGLEDRVIRMIHQHGLKERVILSSFNPLILLKAVSLDPSLKIGLNFLNDFWQPLRKLWFFPFMRPYSVHPEPSMLDEKMAEFARKRKAKLIPWQVNEEKDICRALELGAGGLISDFPTRLKKVYNEWCARRGLSQSTSAKVARA